MRSLQIFKSNKWSGYAYILCVVVMSYTSFIFYPRWQHVGSETVTAYDVAGYYWYLPSIFVYHDLKHQNFKDTIIRKYEVVPNFEHAMLLPNGNYVMKYASGMSLMYLPFFTAAHLVAGALGYPRDGFSLPYQLAIQLGGFFTALLGLWYLRKLLLLFYSDAAVSVSLLLLVLGTNYLNTSVIDVGMSHGWLFTIYVFLLLNTVYFHQTGQFKYAVRIGLLVGLATLTRPPEALCCLIPILWGMDSLRPAAIRKQLTFLLSKYKMLLVAVLCASAVISIQLIYWKYVSGNWIVYSYGTQKLYFRSPNFINYTFGALAGWLRYTPMMLLAFAGLFPFLISGKHRVAITTVFLVNYYVVCCWSIWWYGGRAMVQSYPVLMFPIASLVTLILNRKFLLLFFVPVAAVFTYLNFWITVSYHTPSLYDNSMMTNAYYWHVVGRWHVPDYTMFLKDGTDMFTGTPTNKQLIWQNDFEEDTNRHTLLTDLKPIQGKRSLQLDESTRFAIPYKFPAANVKAHWLQADADYYCEHMENTVWSMSELIVGTYKNGELLKQNTIRAHRVLGDGVTKKISLYMDIHDQAFDSISVGFWNGYSTKRVLIDNVKVYTFDEGR